MQQMSQLTNSVTTLLCTNIEDCYSLLYFVSLFTGFYAYFYVHKEEEDA